MPIRVPGGVRVALQDHSVVVTGPKGELSVRYAQPIDVKIEGDSIVVTRPDDAQRTRQLHGLTRTLIANMLDGVTRGFSKTLEITGVGYRAQMQGKQLMMQLGFSHPVTLSPPAGISISLEGPSKITVAGADKQRVGEFAAQIRRIRPPEPYKGKGIRYEGERVRRKLGKAGKTAGKK
jgi:large subunit ribosomal protein L6